MTKSKGKLLVRKFDPEFRFLIDRDPTMEVWRAWAADYWMTINKNHNASRTALCHFLIAYIYRKGLHTLAPAEFFAVGRELPPVDVALNGEIKSEKQRLSRHAIVSDFLDWILRVKLTVDVDGLR